MWKRIDEQAFYKELAEDPDSPYKTPTEAEIGLAEAIYFMRGIEPTDIAGFYKVNLIQQVQGILLENTKSLSRTTISTRKVMKLSEKGKNIILTYREEKPDNPPHVHL